MDSGDNFKRLFVALPLEKEFLKAFSQYRDMMGRETPYLRWAHVADLHITALFIGDVANGAVQQVSEEVQNLCKISRPLSLLFDKIYYAPPDRPTSMVWAVFRKSVEFESFENNLFERVSALARKDQSLFPEFRPQRGRELIPHITLARLKPNTNVTKLARLQGIMMGDRATTIKECLVMESKLTSAGPIYKVMSAHSLG